jgi:hypothetical protein
MATPYHMPLDNSSIIQIRNLSLIIYFLQLQFLAGITKSVKIPRNLPPTSHARWMAYAIYAILMFLFHDTFPMSTLEKAAVEEIAKFVVHIYSVMWFRAPFVADSAPLDLRFWNNLQEYEQ